jgi:hypothetical protein
MSTTLPPALWRAAEPFVYRPHGSGDASYAVQRALWRARVRAARAELAAGR